MVNKNQIRKYFIKENWIFNLESMSDYLSNLDYDYVNGIISDNDYKDGILGYDLEHISDLKEECEKLEWIAKTRKVTSKEYGRIKEIVEFRVGVRYVRCLNSGMNEKDAGECFSDL